MLYRYMEKKELGLPTERHTQGMENCYDVVIICLVPRSREQSTKKTLLDIIHSSSASDSQPAAVCLTIYLTQEQHSERGTEKRMEGI